MARYEGADLAARYVGADVNARYLGADAAWPYLPPATNGTIPNKTDLVVGTADTQDVSGSITGDDLTWSLDTAPTGVTISAITGIISYPDTLTEQTGSAMTVRATNDFGFETQSFTITVSAAAAGVSVASSDADGDGSTTSSYSFSLDMGAGGDVVIATGHRAVGTFTTNITVAGVTATIIQAAVNSNNNVVMAYATGVPSGLQTVTVSLNIASDRCVARVWTLSNADMSSITSSSSATSTTIDTTTDGLLLAQAFSRIDSSPTPSFTAGVDARGTFVDSDSPTDNVGALYGDREVVTGATGVTVSYSHGNPPLDGLIVAHVPPA